MPNQIDKAQEQRVPVLVYEPPAIIHRGLLKQFSGSPLGFTPPGDPFQFPGAPGAQ